ncbi:MAG: hypothetical protein Q3976_06885 [Corynebacterium sp.]|nr:hypothetical protein [Corynebacterium sp.]
MQAISIFAAILITAFLVYCWSTAQRLHRLQIRVDAALDSLEAALDHRAVIVSLLDPNAKDLCTIAEAVRLSPEQFDARAAHERKIAEAAARIPTPWPEQVTAAETKVQIAYRFYNDAVLDFRGLRLRPLVRVLHLGGAARIPEFFEYPLLARDAAQPHPGEYTADNQHAITDD